MQDPRAYQYTSAAFLQRVIVPEDVVVVAEDLARRLVLSKFTIVLKLVVNLKSFKILSKFIEISSLTSSFIIVGSSGRLEPRSPSLFHVLDHRGKYTFCLCIISQ